MGKSKRLDVQEDPGKREDLIGAGEGGGGVFLEIIAREMTSTPLLISQNVLAVGFQSGMNLFHTKVMITIHNLKGIYP